MTVWKTAILCHTNLIDEFYTWKRNANDIKTSYDNPVKLVKHTRITNGDELLLAGLLLDGPKDNRDVF